MVTFGLSLCYQYGDALLTYFNFFVILFSSAVVPVFALKLTPITRLSLDLTFYITTSNSRPGKTGGAGGGAWPLHLLEMYTFS